MYRKEELLEIFNKNLYIVRDNQLEYLGDGWFSITKYMISDYDIEELNHILPIEEYEIESNNKNEDIEIDDILYIKIKEGGEKYALQRMR